MHYLRHACMLHNCYITGGPSGWSGWAVAYPKIWPTNGSPLPAGLSKCQTRHLLRWREASCLATTRATRRAPAPQPLPAAPARRPATAAPAARRAPELAGSRRRATCPPFRSRHGPRRRPAASACPPVRGRRPAASACRDAAGQRPPNLPKAKAPNRR